MTRSKHWLFDLSLQAVLIALFFGIFLGNRPLLTPDEGRYVEIPREMVESGDYVTPHLNYLKYFEKPPLFYWLESLPVQFFGLNEWGLRTVPAFLGLIGCLAVYIAGRRLFGRPEGLLASFSLATSLLYFVMSHLIIPDILVTLCLTLCLLAFILGNQTPQGWKRNTLYWAMYAAAGLAVLSKGLIGIIFPGMIIFAWLCCTQKWRDLKNYCLPSGIALFLIITFPWHVLVQMKNPEFFHFYFIEQQFLRYFTPYAGREQPIWFFPLTVIAGFFPWILFFPWIPRVSSTKINLEKVKQFCQRHQNEVFLLLWIVLITLFFTFSHSLLVSYALPVMPALALLNGRYLAGLLNQPRSLSLSIRFTLIALLIATIGIVGLIIVKPTHPLSWYAIIALTFISAFAILLSYYCLSVKAAIVAVYLGFGACLVGINLSYINLDIRSIKPLAMQLRPLLKVNTPVISYQEYYQDLPVYLERRIIIANYTGELAFGIAHQNTSHWVLDEPQLLTLWQKPARAYLIMRRKDFHELLDAHKLLIQSETLHFYTVGQTVKNILLTNHPL